MKLKIEPKEMELLKLETRELFVKRHDYCKERIMPHRKFICVKGFNKFPEIVRQIGEKEAKEFQTTLVHLEHSIYAMHPIIAKYLNVNHIVIMRDYAQLLTDDYCAMSKNFELSPPDSNGLQERFKETAVELEFETALYDQIYNHFEGKANIEFVCEDEEGLSFLVTGETGSTGKPISRLIKFDYYGMTPLDAEKWFYITALYDNPIDRYVVFYSRTNSTHFFKHLYAFEGSFWKERELKELEKSIPIEYQTKHLKERIADTRKTLETALAGLKR